MRDQIMEHIMKGKNDNRIYNPVAFEFIINNIKGQLNIHSNSMVDITVRNIWSY